jgi:hypothetical protein
MRCQSATLKKPISLQDLLKFNWISDVLEHINISLGETSRKICHRWSTTQKHMFLLAQPRESTQFEEAGSTRMHSPMFQPADR